MPRYNYDLFVNEARLLFQEYCKKHKPGWYRLMHQDIEIPRAYQLYSNCLNSNLPLMVLGDDSIRDTRLTSTKELLQNFGITSTRNQDAQRKAARDMNVTAVWQLGAQAPNLATNRGDSLPSNHLSNGSILSDLKWWPFPNDAWLLGGIHSLKTFHLGFKPTDKKIWDSRGSRPRVLGRELVGLHAFGYSRVNHGYDMEMVFKPTDRALAMGATMRDLLAALDRIKNISQVKACF